MIDEVQKAEEEIFPAIKELVGVRRKPGQFLLTGSIRFGLKSAWFESYVEMLLTRDVVLVDPTLEGLPFRSGSAFLRGLAILQGRDLSIAFLCEQSGLSRHLAGRLIRALTALNVIDLITPVSVGKKAAKRDRVEWKDSGLWNHVFGLGSWTPGKLEGDVKPSNY